VPKKTVFCSRTDAAAPPVPWLTIRVMSQSRLVYSTGQGRLCPECTRPLTDCRCRRSKAAQHVAAAPPGDGIVRVGCGGTVGDDGTIEIQGDHRDLLLAELGKLGYTVRKSGG
jgi:translation initiation factor 1